MHALSVILVFMVHARMIAKEVTRVRVIFGIRDKIVKLYSFTQYGLCFQCCNYYINKSFRNKRKLFYLKNFKYFNNWFSMLSMWVFGRVWLY